MLSIKEIYKSIQGETSFAGLPCTFVRLAACDLRCSWCDTEYAFAGGKPATVDEVLDKVSALNVPLVTVTGGEPLLQPDVFPLISGILDGGRTALVETSGAHDISTLDRRAVVVMDLKCPSSGENEKNLMSNVGLLKPTDELKFVIASREDYDWARKTLSRLTHPRILFSWAAPGPESDELKKFPAGHHRISKEELAELILADGLTVRYLPQVHKIIWGETATSR